MARSTPTLTIPDLTGRVAIVTGASDGMGLRIATRLAQAGADVIMPVRNRSKGVVAVRTVLEAAPGARVSLRDLDLASLASVSDLGAALREEGRPLHILINNAGLMTPSERRTTVDGLELQLGTNFVGHYALVGHLLPLLSAGGARVTSQISIAAERGRINWDDLQWSHRYHAMHSYGQSKVALGLFGLELQRRSEAGGWGITSNLAHPGVAPTNLLAAQPGFGRPQDKRELRVIRFLSRLGLTGTPESAALPALMAATQADAASGTLYGPQGLGHLGGAPGVQRLYGSLRSADDAARIWEIADSLVGAADPRWVRFGTPAARG